jgi:hypothetical protein
MEDKIEVFIGKPLIELAEAAVKRGDERSVMLVNDIAHELLMTGVVIAAEDVSLLSIRDYTADLAEAIRNQTSIEDVKERHPLL